MSPKNRTIDEVFEVVQTQGQQIREVLDTVKTQGKQLGDLSHRMATQFTEAFEAVHLLSEHLDKHFAEVEDRFENRFLSIESQMVTKSYLDDKLADLRGDLTLLTRQEDQKLFTLVELLFGKRLMTQEERQHIMALQPFAVT